MRKRIIAVCMVAVLSFSSVQKAYAFAFAPALIPVAVTLLAACGIFIGSTSATEDLERVIDDFLSSDVEVGDFVNGIYEQSKVTGAVLLSTAQVAFLTDVFIVRAYHYFDKVNSDLDLTGTVWHPIDGLFDVKMPFGASFSMSGTSFSEKYSSFVFVLGGDNKWLMRRTFSSSDTVKEYEVVDEPEFVRFPGGSYFSSTDKHYFYVQTISSSGLRVSVPSGAGSFVARAITIGSVGFCTEKYASENAHELKISYLRDTSVSADAIKASLLSADEVYVSPMSDVASVKDYENSVVGVYEGGLINGVVLDPTAVPDEPVIVNPPVTGDLSGLSGILDKLFVPSGAVMSEMGDLIKSKFPIADDLFDIDLRQYIKDGKPRWFFVYEGKEYDIFDFSVFDEYRGFLHAIILAIAYYKTARWTLKVFPSVIKGK